MKKSAICILLVVMLVLTTVMPIMASENELSDWAVDSYIDLSFAGMIDDTRGDFSESVTYDDAFFHISGIYESVSQSYLMMYDLEDPTMYETLKALDLGYISLDEALMIDPYDFPTMKELLVYIYRLFDLYDGYMVNPFKGYQFEGKEDMTNEMIMAIEYAISNGIINGNGSDYGLNDMVSYEQLLVIMKRSFDHINKFYKIYSEGFLYEVSDEDNKVYLFGTVHALTPDMYPLSAKVLEAFESSKILALEADTKKPLSEEEQQIFLLEESETLDSLLSEEIINRLDEFYQTYYMTSISQLNMLKPWVLFLDVNSLSLQLRGFMPNYGIENYLTMKTSNRNMEFEEIEGTYSQLQVFDSLNDETISLLIEDALASLEEDYEYDYVLYEIMDAYYYGSEEQFKMAANEDPTSIEDYDNKILYDRNEKMAKSVIEYLEGDEDVFFAVGSMHLIGDKSVCDILNQQGINVTRIN